ncbi:integrin alpha-PS1 [Hyalella azteca]|uniref:Integrin alpha-PS1 n=1 Tax=Hyalella azteca TaxID=294128 RepID=A0A8B7N4N3_HYAAZ|nr:integrin alpha-PS1 [Hyalella azteca]
MPATPSCTSWHWFRELLGIPSAHLLTARAPDTSMYTCHGACPGHEYASMYTCPGACPGHEYASMYTCPGHEYASMYTCSGACPGHEYASMYTCPGHEYASMLLVGAPKDHNLQPGTHRSGALWKCPFTSNSSDCVQVHTDGFKDPDSGLYDFFYANENLLPPNDDEIKDDQWLGVTVKSRLVVCAHRYMHRGPGFQWGFGLCYLLNQKLDVMDSMEPCRGKAVAKGHQQYGFCQAGMSGLILDDEVVLGLPGPYTWRGTVHTSNISKNFLLRDKTQYFGPVTENDSPVDKYSYLGYSVTTGYFFGDYVSYVGGAPRSNGTGQVVFFSRAKIGESLLVVDLVLDGEMFASSFGFEVLGLDINRDGFDDLLVSAPFYYTKHNSGAVYVYINNQDGIKKNHMYSRIEGPAGESRFGFSMTSLGDLNRDGYLDVAIGAPYEDRGAIYILCSGEQSVLLRARPVIMIQTIVLPEGGPRNIDPTKPGCPDDQGSEDTCFSFEACFKMDNDAGTRTGLLLSYSIEELVYRDQPLPRVYFEKEGTTQTSVVKKKIQLRPEDMGRHQCTREVAYLKPGNRDVLRPLKFKLSYEIIQREPQPMREGGPIPNMDDFPILDQQEALRYFEAHFLKDCGADNKCDSDLNLNAAFQLPWDDTRSHQVFELGLRNVALLEASVTNSGDPAYEPSLFVEHHDSMAFSIKESDCRRSAGLARLYGMCVPVRADLVHCTLGNPLTNSTGPLLLAFKPSGFFDKRFIRFKVFANSTSNERTPQDNIDLVLEILKRAEVSITGSVTPEQVFFGGEIVGESGVTNVHQIGSEVVHKYVVDNRGPWRSDYVEVKILWPHQMENHQDQGSWLLYLTEKPVVDGDGECSVDPAFVDPLRFMATSSSSSSSLEQSSSSQSSSGQSTSSQSSFSQSSSSQSSSGQSSSGQSSSGQSSFSQSSSGQSSSGQSSSGQFFNVGSEVETQPSGGIQVSYSNKTVTTKVVTSKVNTIRTESKTSKDSVSGTSDAVVNRGANNRIQSMSEKVQSVTTASTNKGAKKSSTKNYEENYEDYDEYPDEYYDDEEDDYYRTNHIRRKRYTTNSLSRDKSLLGTELIRENASTGNNWPPPEPYSVEGVLPSPSIPIAGVLPPDEENKFVGLQIITDSGLRSGEYSTVDRLVHRRSKRQGYATAQYVTDGVTGRTLQAVTLRCTGDVPTAKCIPIRCTIRNLGAESSASIRIVSRLWNATLVEDYAHVNLVNVQSRGELLLPEDIRSRQDESDDVAVAETKAYANLLEQPQSVPLWVILVSVFAGLLLLALIILILCKMGFFERRRRPDTNNLMRNGH